MIRKAAGKVVQEVSKRVLSGIERDIANLSIKLEALQLKNSQLVTELIVEQRLREDRDLSGGVFAVSEREVATRLFNGLIMYLDPHDIAVAPHIILEGTWERQITTAWQTILDSGPITVFDVGSNFGYFGMLAAQPLDKKNSKVILFEANPFLIPYIKKNLSVNWLNENSVVENLAISDNNGVAQLNVLEDYTGSSSMHTIEHLDSYLSHKMSIKAEKVIDVETITIDDYCKNKDIGSIDLMKMDIEGYEEKAYKGMAKIVAASKNMVFFIEFTKDGYEDPKGFYFKLLNDFAHLYVIDSNGNLTTPRDNSYEGVVENAADWVMLVFSKKVQIADGKKQ